MSRRRRSLAAAASTGVLVVLLTGALWPVPVLRVSTDRPERRVWETALRGPIPIRLEYRHSVERTPVVELYEASPRGLRLVGMEFASQGAGLPSSGFVREGGRYVLRTDRPLAALPVRVSGIADQRLRIGDRVFALSALVGEGGTVTVAVVAAPRMPLLRGVLY